MVLIFTDNEILNKDLNKNIENSRVVYYPDYILEEKEANVLIATLQPNKYNFKDFMFKVREKNIRVILNIYRLNKLASIVYSIINLKKGIS